MTVVPMEERWRQARSQYASVLERYTETVAKVHDPSLPLADRQWWHAEAHRLHAMAERYYDKAVTAEAYYAASLTDQEPF